MGLDEKIEESSVLKPKDSAQELDHEKHPEKDRKKDLFEQFKITYSNVLDEDMGKLHDQFVVFIQNAGLSLPQTLLVLQMLVRKTIDQAVKKYLGG